MLFYAHSANCDGRRQLLSNHLHRVAQLAQTYAAPLGGAHLGCVSGLLHDVGKYALDFQHYLQSTEQDPHGFHHGPDHKQAGMYLALQAYSGAYGVALAQLIEGHHGGLKDRACLLTPLQHLRIQPGTRVLQALQNACQDMPSLRRLPPGNFPTAITTAREREVWLRFVYSALKDADFLDTEAHFRVGTPPERNNTWTIDRLWHVFEPWYHVQFPLSLLTIDAHTPLERDVQRARRAVYQACIDAASRSPGCFRLTVPTGGGKTLASLGFALKHASLHHFQRVIYAIPYTSIIDQTCQQFRTIFRDEAAVLEHHSQARIGDSEHPSPAQRHAMFACENWDAPLIVTTTVQLFESLLGNSASVCRKLHNIAQSVLVLDEVHLLPVHLLSTLLDMLRQLVRYYHITVVLCTATPPNFHATAPFADLPGVYELAPHPEELYKTLQRVTYAFPCLRERWSWERVVRQMEAEEQVAVIVNTRADAHHVFRLLRARALKRGQSAEDIGLYHLSTSQCGAHRRAILEAVTWRLKRQLPCHLVATQVVEAGVDIDFPLLLRAWGPLVSLAQAAGRVNRHGRWESGRIIIFRPFKEILPKGGYRLATSVTWSFFQDHPIDLSDPETFHAYFRELYRQAELDQYDIETLREQHAFKSVAQRFHMIEGEQCSVLVPYPSQADIECLVARCASSTAPARQRFRTLQPFLVSMFKEQWERAYAAGRIRECLPGLGMWTKPYDADLHGCGLVYGEVNTDEEAMG